MHLRCKKVLLSNEELSKLKEPAGVLIKDADISKDIISKHIKGLVISIGDATTDRLLAMNIIPDIQIVDGKERRYARKPAGRYYEQELRCINPAGSITLDAINVFKQALKARKPVRILVDGEEDLFGLIALAYAPNNSTIFYGQPLEGMVIMRADNYTKDRFKSMIDKILKLGNDDVAAV